MVSLTQPLSIAAKMFPSRGLKDSAKRSFSQCGEDLIVKFVFDAIGIKKPSYLDIGAYHPFTFSNTALFYLDGSTGINIEPNPDLFKQFVKHRNRDINLNIGISESEGQADFYLMSSATLNTLSRAKAEQCSRDGCSVESVMKVKVDKIENVINRYCNGQFPDFLSLDAEGSDFDILKSIDYTRTQPTIICAETLTFSNNGRGEKQTEVIAFLETKGYMAYADTHINTIFVRRDRWVRG